MTENQKIEIDFMIKALKALGPNCNNRNYEQLVDKVIDILIRL